MKNMFIQSALSKSPKSWTLVKNFTLTELLVVIAIFLILISLLQPALLKTLRTAEKLTCLNKLKSIGSATAVYCGDNNDFYPRARIGGNAPSKEDWYNSQEYAASSYGKTWTYSALIKYFGGQFDHNNYRCPSDKNEFVDPVNHPYPSSYMMNERIGGMRKIEEEYSGSFYSGRRQDTQISRPFEILLYIDQIPSSNVGWTPRRASWDPLNRMSRRHVDGTENSDLGPGLGNASFADGHAAEIDRTWMMQEKYVKPDGSIVNF